MSPNKRSGSRAKLDHHTNWTFPGKLENEARVLHAILPEIPVDRYQLMVDEIRNLIVSLVRNHGYTDGPKRYNIIKNYTISLIEGREPENPGWISTSEKFGVPSKLGKNTVGLVVYYLEQTRNPATRDDRCYQAILTLLNIIRKVRGLSDPDFISITKKARPINKDLLSKFETYVSEKLGAYRFTPDSVNLSSFSVSINRKGPNGIPKVESSHKEAKRLVEDKLFRPFKNLCTCLGIDYLCSYVVSLSEMELSIPETAPRNVKSFLKSKKPVNLRIVVPIPDSGCKTRVVAIPDFWTQLVLEPIRVHVQRVTESLFRKSDFRLDQEAGVASVVSLQELCMNREVINGVQFSIENLGFLDASSWTDRFHRDLQKIVMKELFSPSIAESWAQLVVHCDWYAPTLGRTIKYGQGQGMGTNGSFDVAVLTDHLLINMIYDEDPNLGYINNHVRPLYAKVGDDLACYNYQSLLKVYDQINLDINLSKSKVACNLGSVAEFCSRTFINGKDVSRISPNIISKSKDFKYLPSLISLCHTRDITLTRSLFPYLDRKASDGETYLEKLQPYLLGLFTLSQVEKSNYVASFNIQEMVDAGWMINDRYVNICHDPQAVARLLLSHSIVKMGETTADLQDKIFELVDGMEFYGDEIIDLLKKDFDWYNMDSEGAQFLLMNPFHGQTVLYPTQLVTLLRYRNQHTLLRSRLDYYLDLTPESPEEVLQMVKEISRIVHRSCYDGGSLNYDIPKMYRIQFGIVKTLDKLSEDFKTLTVEPELLRNVLTYVNYDLISEKWPEYVPQLQDS